MMDKERKFISNIMILGVIIALLGVGLVIESRIQTAELHMQSHLHDEMNQHYVEHESLTQQINGIDKKLDSVHQDVKPAIQHLSSERK